MSDALTIYYRVTPRSNNKGRPAWFSKHLALRSMLVSLERCTAPYSIVYVADGGVPAELSSLIEQTGEVVPITGGSAAKSMRRLLDLLQRRDAAGGPGLLWLAEDDYLYRPEAFPSLVAASDGIPEAGYFTLYTPDNSAWHATHRSQPGRRGPEEERWVGDVRWRRTYDANSSFGIRRGLVASDARVLRAASFAGSPFDHTTVMVTSGMRPYSWRHLFSDLYLQPNAVAIGRAAARPVVRASLNLAQAARGSGAGHQWWAPAEDLSTHVEQGFLSANWDPQAYAEQLTAAGDGPRSGGAA